jgi:AhpC/TSA family
MRCRRIMMRKRFTRRLTGWLVVGGLSFALTAPMALASDTEGAATSMPKVGQMAPDFTLNYFDGNDLKKISLSEYRGKKNVVVAFFIFAFTGG